MIPITAGAPPGSYQKARADGQAFQNIASVKAVRLALWEEQGRRCAYCERRLKKPTELDHNTRIEHFHPQAATSWSKVCSSRSGAKSNDEAPTEWSNLLLCCDGNEKAGRDWTCDTLKANRDICETFFNPKTWKGKKSLVHIDRQGIATPIPPLPSEADDVLNKVLNLNAAHLVQARQQVMNEWLKHIRHVQTTQKGLTSSQRRTMAQKIRQSVDQQKKEYASSLLSLAHRLDP